MCSLMLADGDLTSTKLNAESRVKLFQQTFKHIQINEVSSFAIAQVADSTAMNPKIAWLMKINHVACHNNCLNLRCRDMERDCPELKDIADKTQEVHHKVKASNKLTAELENIQAISHALNKTDAGRLKMKAVTHWNSLEAMLKSHVENVEGIRQVIETYPECDISEETSSQSFIKKVKKHLPYLSHIKSASVGMQKKLATLEECQFLCDLVATCAKDGKGKAGNDFQYCK
jgi:hypothetical protein